jgi:hypothetical protein
VAQGVGSSSNSVLQKKKKKKKPTKVDIDTERTSDRDEGRECGHGQ